MYILRENESLRLRIQRLEQSAERLQTRYYNAENQLNNFKSKFDFLKSQFKEVARQCFPREYINNKIGQASEKEVYDFYDNPEKYYKKRDTLLEHYKKRFKKLMSLECKPDFICTGGSGSLVFQTPDIFRELDLPIVKEITKLCKEYGIPSHVHSCGPERELVKILAEETDLTVIDP